MMAIFVKKEAMKNPFILSPNAPKSLFCDRERETQDLVRYLENGSDITLISPRRYGKTGLIYHVFEALEEKQTGYETYYVDIYATRSFEDFVTLLAESVYGRLKGKPTMRAFLDVLTSVRPVVLPDPVSGVPQLSFTFQNEQEKRYSLRAVMDYLEHRKKKVVVAIDEFQQVRTYEGVQFEALLRSCIQPLRNVQFIFSGSKRHVMSDMFTGEKSPFYESAGIYPLDKISHGSYAAFIRKQFEDNGKHIMDDAVDAILDWTGRHTYYTQFLCNRVFQDVRKEASLLDVFRCADIILDENADAFLERRNLLTRKQWDYLIAVAKEGTLSRPTSAEFLQKYRLGAPSSSLRTLESLVEKELVLETRRPEGSIYRVYNVFLSHWLERL
jgi:AAA+ ATPase superfamily predicted ATPase